jgi:GH15 family glucan-1,4-alpha-glucosidase
VTSPVNPLTAIPNAWQPLASRSCDLLREHRAPGGAWPASPHFAPYRYSWFRDGSFIAEGASAAGLLDEADRFHAWCRDVLERERPAVDAVLAALAAGAQPDDAEYLPARYRLDGTRQVDDWWNFQVDGYGTWLWALERHLFRAHRSDVVPYGEPYAGPYAGPYAAGIETAVRYLTATGTGTCRDWWEENRDETHVTTLAGVAAGLRAAVRMGTLPPPLAARAVEVAERCASLIRTEGVRDGHLVKWLGGTEVDASLLAVAAVYDVLRLDDPLVTATVTVIEARLVDGGVHRYEADTFYGGGQWPVLAALLAWHHSRAGNVERAAALLDWAGRTADADLLLPEQVAPLLAPAVLDEWVDRWGPSAHPLLWSHGMFLAAVAAFLEPR